MFSLTEVPPQSEEELWLASLTEVISSSEQPAIP